MSDVKHRGTEETAESYRDILAHAAPGVPSHQLRSTVQSTRSAMDVIEHLENPRGFIRQLIAAANGHPFTLVMSLPNPLDTFSTIALFRRGIFNWFSPAHYPGGGHISVIPYWLLDEHLRFLGVGERDWHFLAPYIHDNMAKGLLYRLAGAIRRLMSKSAETRYFEGQAALVVASYEGAAAKQDGVVAAI